MDFSQDDTMSPYGEIWQFTRERLAQSYQDLSPSQILWRPYPGGHNAGELIYHIAGVEAWFATRMTGGDATADVQRLMEAARATFITEDSFPYGDDDMEMARLDAVLAQAADLVGPVVRNPTEGQLTMDVETVIGPVVSGVACLWRLAQHAAYHTGQIWTYRQDPDLPS